MALLNYDISQIRNIFVFFKTLRVRIFSTPLGIYIMPRVLAILVLLAKNITKLPVNAQTTHKKAAVIVAHALMPAIQ